MVYECQNLPRTNSLTQGVGINLTCGLWSRSSTTASLLFRFRHSSFVASPITESLSQELVNSFSLSLVSCQVEYWERRQLSATRVLTSPHEKEEKE
jgi:hypothetical protein